MMKLTNILEQINIDNFNDHFILKLGDSNNTEAILYNKNKNKLANCYLPNKVMHFYKEFVDQHFKDINDGNCVTIMALHSFSLGAGFILIKKVIEYYKIKNKKYIITATQKDNFSAMNLYKKLGFSMLDNLREDAVLFYLKLK